ncbi:MAG: hypothetical protein IPL86_16110 [Flavobacteriales bacterium]|nr:hypothetical protein [Flavobacteriales bacterium]
MEPIGRKPVGCCAEIIWRAMRQGPDEDGIRRSRWDGNSQHLPGAQNDNAAHMRMDWYGHATTLRMDQPITATVRFGQVELELIFSLKASIGQEHTAKASVAGSYGRLDHEAREIRKTTL